MDQISFIFFIKNKKTQVIFFNWRKDYQKNL